MSQKTNWLSADPNNVASGDRSGSFFFEDDLAGATVNNQNYRDVVFTTPQFQMVYMCLLPGEDIPGEFPMPVDEDNGRTVRAEIHRDATQFFRVESGSALFIVNGKKVEIKDDGAVIVPSNTPHYVKNSSREVPLKMYVIYSPPEHPAERLDERQPKKGKN